MEAEINKMDLTPGKRQTQKMKVLMKQSQSKLDDKERQKHTKRQLAKISKPLTNMRIE